MKLPSIPYLVDAFINVLRRFPLVMVAALVGTFATMICIENGDDGNTENYLKVILTCSLGLSTLLCAALIVEKWKLSMPLALVPHVVAVGLLVLYYFTLDSINDHNNIATPFRFIGLNLAAHLGVAFVPYLDGSPVEDFWEYNKRLFGNFMVGAFYSIVIFVGLCIAILAVNELFNLNIDEDIYGHLFVLLAGIFNTAFFLAHFPKEFDFGTEPTEIQSDAKPVSPYTVSFKNLTKFILIPIVAIYFLILYAFSAKILVTWELPEGWVGKLVLGFSVAGIFTYLLNFLLVKYDDSTAVRGFRRWFFHILLPMVALLFVAVGRRISDYGLTEARYVVAICGVWLLFMSLYFIVSKRDNIKFIPISLAFFALLTVLGPFNAFNTSARNQAGRLKAVLEKNNMFKDGKVVPATDSLSKEDAEHIRTGIDYLRENGRFSTVAPWFDLPADSIPDWQATDKLMEKLDVQVISPTQTYCAIYFESKQQPGIEVTGYDVFYQVYAYAGNVQEQGFTGFAISEGKTGLQYFKDGEKLDSFALQPYLRMLEGMSGCNGYNQPDSLSTFEVDGLNLHLKMKTENVSFENDGTWQIREINGKVLLRKKQ